MRFHRFSILKYSFVALDALKEAMLNVPNGLEVLLKVFRE
jgi:hypothetical protein